MPLFGGKRPPLDGLTKEEEKRRGELNDALAERTAGKDGAAQGAAIIEVLQEHSAAESSEFLWPLLIGWQMMSMRHFTDAIDSFKEAAGRNGNEVRSFYGGGSAYMKAGASAQSLGSSVTAAMVPPNKSAEDLYIEAGRCFQTAITLTKDKNELEQLHQAESEAATALARSVKRS